MTEFKVIYEFTSTKADADSYIRTRIIKAKDEACALTIAKIVGFSEFGEKFTENCIDWRIAHDEKTHS